ncbi:restin homolog [Lytechinus variegatus]|uniref:restin homolog n=1 Tax=Lytechinus variegatus TaxID=7654 RepID=UPI001BB0DB6E|nr:restin homolog [Lytechinus variegatus]
MRQDVQIVLKFLRESFDFEPSTSPADTVSKLRFRMASADNKIKRMKEQLKSNEILVKACKGLTGVSGPLAPDGLADLITSIWSKQKHVISQLKIEIQKFKENRPSQTFDITPIGHSDQLLTGLAQLMDIDTTNTQTSTIVDKMKVTFIDLKDMVKVKDDKIQNLCDREKKKTKRIVELQNEIDDLQTKNIDLALDLQEAQDKRQTAENRVFDFENKIRYLEEDIEKKTSEIEDLLQRYEDAGEVILDLQNDLEEAKKNNASLEKQIKDIQTREFKKDEYILTLEKDLATLKQRMDLDSFSEDHFMTSKANQNALKLQKQAFDQELKNLRSNGQERDYYVLKLEQDIENMQKEKDVLYQEIQELERKNAETTDRLLDLEKEFADLESQRNEKDEENKRLSVEISQRDTNIKQLIAENQQLLSNSQKVKESCSTMSQEKDRLETLVANLTQKTDCLTAQLETAAQDIQELKDQSLSNIKEGKIHQTNAQQLSEENSYLSKQLDELKQKSQESEKRLFEREEMDQHQNEKLSVEIKKTQQQYQDLKERFQSEIDEVTKTRKELTERAAKEKRDLLTELAEARKQLEAFQEKSKRFQKMSDDLGEKNYSLSTEIATAISDNKALKDELKTSKDNCEKAIKILQEKNDALLSELDAVNEKCKDLQEKVGDLQEENKNMVQETIASQGGKNKEVYDELIKSYQECKERGEELERERQQFQENVAKWEKEKANVLKQLESRQIDKDSNVSSPKIPGASANMANLHERTTDLQKDKLDLEEKLQTSAEELRALEEDLNSVKTESEKRVSELQEENDFMIREVASLRDLCLELEESMESMAERNDQLKRVLSLTQEEKDDDLLDELEKSFLRCQDLEDTLKHVQLESKESSDVWNQEKKYLLDQLQDLQLPPKEMGSRPVHDLVATNKLQEQISQLQQDRKGLEEKLREAEKESAVKLFPNCNLDMILK